jgi:hypothetical protein
MPKGLAGLVINGITDIVIEGVLNIVVNVVIKAILALRHAPRNGVVS